MHARFNGLLALRNRVAHHEPIYDLDHALLWEEFTEALEWLDPGYGALALGESRVPALVAVRPRPRNADGEPNVGSSG